MVREFIKFLLSCHSPEGTPLRDSVRERSLRPTLAPHAVQVRVSVLVSEILRSLAPYCVWCSAGVAQNDMVKTKTAGRETPAAENTAGNSNLSRYYIFRRRAQYKGICQSSFHLYEPPFKNKMARVYHLGWGESRIFFV